MKIKKRRKKELKQVKTNDYKVFIVLAMIISMIIAMITYWIYAYHEKYGDSEIDRNIISYKIDDYVVTLGNIIVLNNIDIEVSKEFKEKQEKILNNNKILNTEIKKNLKDEYLSIYIKYTLEDKYIDLALNYDLKNRKILKSDDMIILANTTYKDIASDIFNKYVKLAEDKSITVIDNIDNSKLSSKEFNNSRDKYIIRIREAIPEYINLYVENNDIYYEINYKNIEKLTYNKDNNNFYIKEKIGSL